MPMFSTPKDWNYKPVHSLQLKYTTVISIFASRVTSMEALWNCRTFLSIFQSYCPKCILQLICRTNFSRYAAPHCNSWKLLYTLYCQFSPQQFVVLLKSWGIKYTIFPEKLLLGMSMSFPTFFKFLDSLLNFSTGS